MIVYSIYPHANQTFSVEAEGWSFDFVLRSFRGLLYASVTNGEGVVPSAGMVRCANKAWLIPWRPAGSVCGNFRFEDREGEYPDTDNFASSCRLVYYSAAEIAKGV